MILLRIIKTNTSLLLQLFIIIYYNYQLCDVNKVIFSRFLVHIVIICSLNPYLLSLLHKYIQVHMFSWIRILFNRNDVGTIINTSIGSSTCFPVCVALQDFPVCVAPVCLPCCSPGYLLILSMLQFLSSPVVSLHNFCSTHCLVEAWWSSSICCRRSN